MAPPRWHFDNAVPPRRREALRLRHRRNSTRTGSGVASAARGAHLSEHGARTPEQQIRLSSVSTRWLEGWRSKAAYVKLQRDDGREGRRAVAAAVAVAAVGRGAQPVRAGATFGGKVGAQRALVQVRQELVVQGACVVVDANERTRREGGDSSLSGPPPDNEASRPLRGM